MPSLAILLVAEGHSPFPLFPHRALLWGAAGLAAPVIAFAAADAVPGEELPGEDADEAAPKRLKARVSLCPALYGLPTIKMK